MRREPETTFETRAEEIRRQIEYWRTTRRRQSPMPGDLWDAAVGLAREQGICPVARALHVDYGSLKRRLTASDEAGDGGVEPDAFVEFQGSELLGTAAPAGLPVVVEFTGADGARMTIRLPGDEWLDVQGLAASFWRRDR